MKNVLNDKPNLKLFGRYKFSVGLVADNDIINKRVLDIGCGYGWFIQNALERGVREITGIEISIYDLKTVKKNIRDKKATFKIGSAIKLPYPDKYFDTVVAWEVLEHTPKNSEEIMFQEVYRVLKNNGVFYLSTPYRAFISTVLDPAFWLTGHRHYTKKEINALGKKNNFKVKKVLLKGAYWNIFGMWNMYIAKWLFRRNRFFDNALQHRENKEFESKKVGFMQIYAIYKK